MIKSIYIIGAGGLGREVRSMLLSIPEWEVKGYFDDHIPKGTLIDDVNVVGNIQDVSKSQEQLNLVLAIGDPKQKKALIHIIEGNRNLTFPTLMHPSAQLLNTSSIIVGKGCLICPGSILTTNIIIHDFVLININATVGHDCEVGSTSSIMPGVNLAGRVKIGTGVLVGSGATILNGLLVSDYATVGAGAVVTKSVEAGITVIGIPANKLK